MSTTPQDTLQAQGSATGVETMTAGGALLARLKTLGVDYIFANSGTDFPPIIEGLAEARAKQIDLPEALIMPHEHAAMGMAHGYYFATGKAQAVMAHTNVGLANCAIGAINAATDHVPMLLFSGRTPVVERDRLGARTVPIGWGQEMRDQAALVREASKWDYELRFPEQVAEMTDRAYAISTSAPKGPVYMSLPREVLCEPCPVSELAGAPAMASAQVGVHAGAIAEAAKLIANAEKPLIIAQRGTGSAEAFDVFSKLVDDWGIAVSQYWAVQLALPTRHPMNLGADLEPYISEADVIVVLDCLAPWAPDSHKLKPGTKVIQIGQNPLYSRSPVRNFRSDLTIMAETADAVLALSEALSPYVEGTSDVRAQRRSSVAAHTAKLLVKVDAAAEAGGRDPMSKAYVAKCLSDAIQGKPTTVLSELGCPMAQLDLKEHGAWFQEPHSGGLGWSFPCALGYQLADKKRLVVATLGDGSYMFANPVACHQIAESLGLPLLLLVLNNAEWGAVRHSVTGIYPDGYAAKSNDMPLVDLSPSPDFTKVAAASRAWTASVTDPLELPKVLADAIRHIEENRTQALVEIKIGG
ncbi:thiamine pyrophosphate-requiring protein [Roseibium sp. CAU 1637]|uniref:Thiamine pyrophosphate-requiring protein n=1 Tax=Roseibium limicola TaxID=2816037 RepID=A0A939EPY4_9HYPH|nr:thiamine pyrophosphate-requiring protein [Roseibium limicola]MBO0346378.1 thiamine pyrophosphate-requiring protein [Roseibium limicola]